MRRRRPVRAVKESAQGVLSGTRRLKQFGIRDLAVTREAVVNQKPISIKDRLKTVHRILNALPHAVRVGAMVCASSATVLFVVAVTISNVIVHQGYETVSLAKPAAVGRTVRPHQVARFGGKVSHAFGIRSDVAVEFADWILEASERQGLKPELLASLVLTESTFRKDVRSNVGAIGPTQIRPDYWGGFCGDSELTDPEQNVYCGAQVLSHMLERCSGDHACALSAYNVGPYAKRDRAAKRYVAKIDRYLNSLENTPL
jgi:hypothetical protein